MADNRKSLPGNVQRLVLLRPRPVDGTAKFTADPAEWPDISDWCRAFQRGLSALGEVKAAEIAEMYGSHLQADQDKLVRQGYTAEDAWVMILAESKEPLRAAQVYRQGAALNYFRSSSDRNGPVSVSVNAIGLDTIEKLIPRRGPEVRDGDSEARFSARRSFRSFEARLLTNENERREFARNLAAVRLMRGAGFSETQRSLIGEVRLAFAELYALYDGAEPKKMLAGVVLHHLAMFSQSYPKPDLTDFPPETVIEFGEWWAKAAGASRIMRQAAWIIATQRKAQAVLLYPIVKPWNLSIPYGNDFDRVSEPIEWPYARTLNSDKIYVQAIVSQGEKLANMVAEARS